MKLTTKQLKQMIRESLEQANEETLDDSMNTVVALRNAIVRELDSRGRYIDRASVPQIDKLMLQIFELSHPKR